MSILMITQHHLSLGPLVVLELSIALLQFENNSV
jgi:hypothetical protein